MKKTIFFWIFLLNCSSIIAQHSEGNLESIIIIDSLEKLVESQTLKIQELGDNQKQLEMKIRDLGIKQDFTLDIAGKIIDWSGFVLTASVFLFGIAAFVAKRRFDKIDELSKSYEENLRDAKNNYQLEFQQIQELKNLFENEQKSSTKLIFPLLEAQWLFYQGDFEEAIKSFKKAKKIKPDDLYITDKLSKVLVETGKINEAVEILEKALAIHKNDITLKRRLTQVYRRDGQFGTAEVMAKEILQQGNHAPTEYELGCIALFTGRYELAEKTLIEANKNYLKYNGDAKYWTFINLAIALEKQGKLKEAVVNANYAKEIVEENLKRRPKNPQLWLVLGLVNLIGTSKKYRKSIEAFQKAHEYSIPSTLAKSNKRRINLILESVENKSKDKILALLGLVKG